MPREQVQWFRNESVHDNDKFHAQQCCTYYSIVNVNKANYPFLSSYEQEQTWTLTRTVSNNHKRYQSSIENIHLTVPNISIKTKHVDYENVKIKKNRSNSVLPSTSSSIQKYTSTTALQSSSMDQQQDRIIIPIKTMTSNSFKPRKDSNAKRTRSTIKPMRVSHSNGQFVVRI